MLIHRLPLCTFMLSVFLSNACIATSSNLTVLELEEAAQKIYVLLELKEYQKVDSILSAFRDQRVYTIDGYSAYHVIIDRISDNVELGKFVEGWLKQDSSNSMPHLLYGAWSITAAWNRRGGGYADTVQPEGWKGFGEYLEQARKHLEKAYELNHNEYAACSFMITVEMGIGCEETMNLWFSRAVEILPDYWHAYSKRAWGMHPRWGGNEDELILFLDEMVNKGSKYALIKFLWLSRERKNQTKQRGSNERIEAERILKDLEKNYPNSTAVKRDAARHLYKTGQKRDAIELMKKAVTIDPQSENCYLFAYYLYWANKNNPEFDYQETLEWAERAIELNPYEDDHWRLAGWICNFGINDYDKALFHYTKAIELKNGQKVTLRTRGDLYLFLNKYYEAIEDYEKSLLIDPSYAQAHYGLGRVYHRQGDKKKAENAFKMAIECNPKLRSKIERFLQ